jgi:hypothetical protein
VCGNFELLLEVIADSDEEFLSVLQRLRAMSTALQDWSISAPEK